MIIVNHAALQVHVLDIISAIVTPSFMYVKIQIKAIY